MNEGTEQVFNVVKIHFYPLYEDIFQHDIAIVEIDGLIKFTKFVQSICLPPLGYKYQEGEKCTVTGWGSNGTTGIGKFLEFMFLDLYTNSTFIYL